MVLITFQMILKDFNNNLIFNYGGLVVCTSITTIVNCKLYGYHLEIQILFLL